MSIEERLAEVEMKLRWQRSYIKLLETWTTHMSTLFKDTCEINKIQMAITGEMGRRSVKESKTYEELLHKHIKEMREFEQTNWAAQDTIPSAKEQPEPLSSEPPPEGELPPLGENDEIHYHGSDGEPHETTKDSFVSMIGSGTIDPTTTNVWWEGMGSSEDDWLNTVEAWKKMGEELPKKEGQGGGGKGKFKRRKSKKNTKKRRSKGGRSKGGRSKRS